MSYFRLLNFCQFRQKQPSKRKTLTAPVSKKTNPRQTLGPWTCYIACLYQLYTELIISQAVAVCQTLNASQTRPPQSLAHNESPCFVLNQTPWQHHQFSVKRCGAILRELRQHRSCRWVGHGRARHLSTRAKSGAVGFIHRWFARRWYECTNI